MTLFRRFPDAARGWSPAIIILPRTVPVYENGTLARHTRAVLTRGWRRLSSDVLEIGNLTFRRYEYCMGTPPTTA